MTAAFIEAGVLALVAIAILLFIALRRVTDVLLTLVPLLLAGAVTLELCVLDGLRAQLRQYHRASAAARRRRRIQDLLHHGLARRKNRPAAIDADASRGVQRPDQCRRVRKHVVVELSGHVEHGQDDGAVAAVHDGGRGVVPAGADGTTATGRGRPGTTRGTARGRRIGWTLYDVRDRYPSWVQVDHPNSHWARRPVDAGPRLATNRMFHGGHDWRWPGSRNNNRLGIKRGPYATLGCIGIRSFTAGLLLSRGRRDGINQ